MADTGKVEGRVAGGEAHITTADFDWRSHASEVYFPYEHIDGNF